MLVLRKVLLPFTICHLFRRSLVLILFGVMGSFGMCYCKAQSVDSPDVKCVSVQANGDVTLTWSSPANTGGFIAYYVDTSSFATGPFATYTIIPTFITSSCIHTGAGANKKPVYYTVYTKSTGGSSAPKDTFSTLFLNVSRAPNGDRAILNWNKICSHTSGAIYTIYRKYSAGNWVLRGSTQNLSYVDTIDFCNKSNLPTYYRIETSDVSGCISVSNVATNPTGVFTDGISPKEAPIDTVSVDFATGKATVSWYPSPSSDATSVVIYLVSSSSNNAIDTVPILPASYLNLASNASNAYESYKIAFLDSCKNISLLSTYSTKTIYLSTSFDICAGTADLLWNRYVNWAPAVSGYEIWKSVNAGAFSLISTNANSDTTYTDTGLEIGNSYCYFVRARNNAGKASSSNKVCFKPNVTNLPKFTYNRFATVTSDKSILLNAYMDTTSAVSYFRLQRATGRDGNFSTLPQIFPKTGKSVTFTDNSVFASTNSYSYRWQAFNTCDKVIMTSNIGATIFLSGTIEPHLEITLTWNDYSKWLGGVDHYEIYRAVDGIWETAPIATTAFTGDGGTYTDDVEPFFSSGSKGLFSYYIKAIEGTGDAFGFTDSSASNIVNVNEYPKYYIPNAFTPNGDGINDVFIPVIGFIDPSEYSFMIFDNTGTLVFETRNPMEGWNGKKKGHPCMENVYMYLIKCKASNGDDSKISGTISLFR